MFSKFSTHMKFTAIIGLVFIFALSSPWAAISENDTDDGIILTHPEIAPQIPDATPNHDLFVKKPPKDKKKPLKNKKKPPKDKTYSDSKVYQVGEGDSFFLNHPSPDQIRIRVAQTSLDTYLAEQGINQVEITAEVTEGLVECEGGTHWHLNFTFGPSGTYFEGKFKPLRLKLKGKYLTAGCHVWLYNEDGEALEARRSDEGDYIKFKIRHFSSYSYDHYDY